jgi:hypothetical protein
MKRFVIAVALACALSGTVLAGNIPTSGTPEPAPASSGNTQAPGIVATIILTIISLSK